MVALVRECRCHGLFVEAQLSLSVFTVLSGAVADTQSSAEFFVNFRSCLFRCKEEVCFWLEGALTGRWGREDEDYNSPENRHRLIVFRHFCFFLIFILL